MKELISSDIYLTCSCADQEIFAGGGGGGQRDNFFPGGRGGGHTFRNFTTGIE